MKRLCDKITYKVKVQKKLRKLFTLEIIYTISSETVEHRKKFLSKQINLPLHCLYF